MKTKVVLTVDTEPSVAGAFDDPENTPLLHEPVWGAVDGESQALGFLVRALARYDLTATFFVEALHTAYFPPDAMGSYVARLRDAGQDVQLHIHPCWTAFDSGVRRFSSPPGDNCSDLPADELTALIRRGADQIEAWTGDRPTGMRTGNFATSASVFEAMQAAGLENASNICLAGFRPPEETLQVPDGVHRFSGVTELPVTCFEDRGPVGRGRLRPMQITALSAGEQIGLLEQVHEKGAPVATIVTHPFEFIKKRDFRYDGLRPNRMVQRRFERLCAFLADNRDRFDVVPLREAAQLDVAGTSSGLVGSPWRASLRAFQNAVNDRL